MQPYHFTARNPISRSKGQSAIAKAAYNAREAIRDERTGEVKDYSRTHHNVLFSRIFIDPKREAPDWSKDRAQLWNKAVGAEKNKNAQEAQEFIAALPHQLTQKGRENVVNDFMRETIMRQTGRVSDVNMHRPPKDGDDRNYHVHILLTMRDIGPEGFGAKKSAQITNNQLDRWKEKFAQRAAKELKREGFALEADRWAVGHLAKPEQLKDAMRRSDFEHAAWAELDATTHRGLASTGMDRKAPGSSDRANVEREKKAANVERMKLKRELEQFGRVITATEKEQEAERSSLRETMHHAQEQVTAKAEKPRSKQQRKRPAPPPREERPLSRVDGEIRMAFSLTAGPERFAEALEDRGFILARVTQGDIDTDRAKNPDKPSRLARAAMGLAVVNSYGDAYTFNERNTNMSGEQLDYFLSGIDQKSLLTVGDARQVMGDVYQQRRAERQHEKDTREKDNRALATRFGDALLGRAIETAMNDPRQRNGEGLWTETAFKDGLQTNRIAFARVTEEEAAQSRREADFAKEAGGYSRIYKAGEIVVVREPGKDPEANRVHKVDQEKAQDYLRVVGSDASQLPNVERTEKVMSDRATMRQQRRTAASKVRPSLGPQRGGLEAAQTWAYRKVEREKDRDQDRPLNPNDYADRQKRERDSSVIDPELYKTDPDYRRQAQNMLAYKSPEEKKQQRENDLRQLREQRER